MTTLVEQIVGSASGSEGLADVLRKCLVLAYKLEYRPLLDWVTHELDGYPESAELPSYRRDVPTAVKANAMTPAYRASNVVVPIDALPSEIHAELSSVAFHQPVGELEDIVSSAHARGDGSVRMNVDGAVWNLVEFENSYSVTDMWREISVAKIAAVLEGARNAALRFALELDSLSVTGEAPLQSPELVTNMFQTVIQGGVVTIAATATGYLQAGQLVVAEGNLESLIERLRSVGIADPDLEALEAAIMGDADDSAEGPGRRVWRWLKALGEGARNTASATGKETITAVATQAVLKYFGLA